MSRTHVQPFCPQPLHRLRPGISARSRFLSARDCQPADPVTLRQQRECFPSRSWPGLRNSARRLASRCSRIGFTLSLSRRYGRVVHLRQLPTPCCHDAVAFGFRRVNVPPDRDFHPAVCTPSQAHARGHSCPQQCPSSVAGWTMPIPLDRSSLLRTRMSALRFGCGFAALCSLRPSCVLQSSSSCLQSSCHRR